MKKIYLLVILITSGAINAFSQWVGTNPIYFNAGNVGIGTSTPSAKLSFMDVSVSSTADGITWYNPSPLQYGIYRTAGTWVAPNYQQLKMSFITGIVIDPGSVYSKSYVDIQGGGLRVSSGNVGIGITTPLSKLHIVDGTGGEQLRFSRGIGSVRFSQGLDKDDLYLYNRDATKTFMFWREDGNVGIGTNNPDAKLAVKGTMHAQEVKVDLSVPGPDYVFDDEYKLLSLEEIKTYIEKNKHLPEVPSAKEMATNGIQVGEMNMLLLKKIEELTLYLIELNKRDESQQVKIELMQKEIDSIKVKN